MSLNKNDLFLFAPLLAFAVLNGIRTYHHYRVLRANNGMTIHTQRLLTYLDPLRSQVNWIEDH